ncbi:hypothetical protein HYS54_02335 [Candidatus Micrarchaeota archaeon]|nr:hypothetical protein [Candidatus Micrarchaeota archaeon]
MGRKQERYSKPAGKTEPATRIPGPRAFGPTGPRAPGEYAQMYGEYLAQPKPTPGAVKGEKQPWFVGFAKRAGKTFKGKPEFKKEEYRAALDFLGWDLTPSQVNAAPLLAFTLAMLACYPLLGFLVFMITQGQVAITVAFYTAPVLFLIPMFALNYVQSYILKAAQAEKVKAAASIPEIINYMVMSMKLSPNIERSLAFASEHGKGKIARDLQELVYNLRVGVYRTAEEGLDVLAYKWGKFSDEFKHALILVRSSTIEIDEAKRSEILDKAVTEVLDGIRDDMTKYAARMRQPSVYLYYVGVLLPLMLIIMLPIGSVMAKLPLAQTWILVLIYNVLVPLVTAYFASSILSKRPPVYTPPRIPDDYPGLPPKNHVSIGKATFPSVVVAVGAAALIYFIFAFFLDPLLNPLPPDYASQAIKEAYFPFFAIAGAVIGASAAASIYLFGASTAKRRVQKEVIEMELEFQDSVYILASRLGENRPIEEAMQYTAEFLEGSHVSKLFSRAVDNIRNLSMTAEMSLFDPVYGALKNVPSDMIRGSMRIVVDSVTLGVQQAAKALISLSLQLRDSQKIKEKIAELLSEITAMMKSIAFLIAPLVLGVTSALQKIVVSALKALAASPSLQAGTGAGGVASSIPVSGFGDPKALASIPDALTFLIIIALYVVEVTILLVYFTSKIEEGDNPLAYKINLARALPLSMVLFFFSAFFAGKMATVS